MIFNKAKYVCATAAFVGSIVLLSGAYVFLNRIIFLSNATSSSATIVAVSQEYVAKGKGSVLAYVPTVQVKSSEGQALELKVDTFNEEPIYTIGQQMRVSCNLERGCIEDTFWAKWGASLMHLLLSLLFFSPLLALRFGLWQPSSEITELKLRGDA